MNCKLFASLSRGCREGLNIGCGWFVCYSHHFRFKINNLEATKKSASVETNLHLIRYLASLEDFRMRFCMPLLHPNQLLHRRVEQIQWWVYDPDWTGL